MFFWLLACSLGTEDSPNESSCSQQLWYQDADADGYGGTDVMLSCEAPSGFSEQGGDCDDDNSDIHPMATESVADGIDQDCDGFERCYLDNDQDGFGSVEQITGTSLDCSAPGEAWYSGDCDDSNAQINPDEEEQIADGVDQNCDNREHCYEDGDGDGFGSSHIIVTEELDCAFFGAATTASDCRDDDPSIPSEYACCSFSSCDLKVSLDDAVHIDFQEVVVDAFVMGSSEIELGRDPLTESRRTVRLTDDYYIMSTEVTQGMFQSLMGYETEPFLLEENGVGTDYPVYSVTWSMAAAFANALTTHSNHLLGENRRKCYLCEGEREEVSCIVSYRNIHQCSGYRLPTEAEWEYAARSGSSASFWTSDDGAFLLSDPYSCISTTLTDGSDLRELALFCGDSETEGVMPVAQRKSNGWTLFDMHGNVAEWTTEGFVANRVGQSENPYISPLETNDFVSYRGGSWASYASDLRAARRKGMSRTHRSSYVGFRLVKPVEDIPLEPIFEDGFEDGTHLSFPTDWSYGPTTWYGNTVVWEFQSYEGANSLRLRSSSTSESLYRPNTVESFSQTVSFRMYVSNLNSVTEVFSLFFRDFALNVYPNGGQVELRVAGNAIESLSTEVWHHVMLQFDDESVAVYANQNLLGTYSYPTGVNLNGGWGSDLSILVGEEGRAFLDSIAIYEGLYDAAEIP